jgi:hypothetical protein
MTGSVPGGNFRRHPPINEKKKAAATLAESTIVGNSPVRWKKSVKERHLNKKRREKIG